MKCIHIDMDCFYAAIEERENPALVGKPVAVGGTSPRSVLCTANYKAREFGCRSAMPAYKAMSLCPDLVIVPVNMTLYKEVSQTIREVFKIFTYKIEPLSLDEAYLDVSHTNSQTANIAREVRHLIHDRTGLTASAGIGPNKMLAKIASDWNKPNGQFEITVDEVDTFMNSLPVKNLWGVGKQSQKRLAALNIETCGDLQHYSRIELYQHFANWGISLYDLCRGIDHRQVKTSRVSKSISKETTFSENINNLDDLLSQLPKLTERLDLSVVKAQERELIVKANVIKLKFADFTQTTAEKAANTLDHTLLRSLLTEAWKRGEGKPVRLLGAGVRFRPPSAEPELDLFNKS